METKTKTKSKIKKRSEKNKRWLVAVFFAFVFMSSIKVADAAEITAQKMIELTNASRIESGLPALAVNSKLTAAAEGKVNDMFKFQYFDHYSPSGVTPWYWIKSAGYEYRYAGENLAIDFVTAEGTHMALMRSISHRDNILKPNYTEIGIAVKKGIFNGSESIIVVEEFGAPLQKEVYVSDVKDVSVSAEQAEAEIKTEREIIVKQEDREVKTAKSNKTAEIKMTEKDEKEEIKKELEKEQQEKKEEMELVEVKSPVIYFKNESNDKGEMNYNKESKDEEKEAEEMEIKLALPTLFPVENIKPLEKTYTDDIFWNNYKEEERSVKEIIISFFGYKFYLGPVDFYLRSANFRLFL